MSAAYHPAMTRFDLAVIGGGPAGVTAALRGAELGANVCLVERTGLGGTCTDDGCAPTRYLAKAARLLRDAEQHPDYGISTARPTVDLAALLAATQRTVYRLHEKKQLIAHLERAGATVLDDSGAAFTDAQSLRLANGSDVKANAFVIACGGHARRLNFPGADLCLTHGDIWSLDRLPSKLVVVGGAATGVQLASIFNAFGSQVTVLELAPRILPAEDASISTALTGEFAKSGIEIVTGIGSVDLVRSDEDVLKVAYRIGESSREAAADAVILAVGWPGNIEGLGLEQAGVATERGYVKVDDGLRTSAPNIWAAGDITGRMMLVQSATHEGRVAGENAVRGTASGVSHAIVAHGGFTDPEYGSVGLTDEAAATGGRPVVTGVVPYADLDRAVIDGRTEGFCKVIVDRERQVLLGAHVVGEQAVEVVQIAAAAMAAEMPIERLAEVEFAYPTFTSIVGLAARQAVHSLRLPEAEAHAWEELGRRRVVEWERREP